MVITTTSEEKVVVTKYMCEMCNRIYSSVAEAEECETGCRKAYDERRREMIIERDAKRMCGGP